MLYGGIYVTRLSKSRELYSSKNEFYCLQVKKNQPGSQTLEMERRPWQGNLAVLTVNDISTFRGEGGKGGNVSDFGK